MCKSFCKAGFQSIKESSFPRVFLFASDITSESLLPKIYNPISAHVTHRSQCEPHWTTFGEFRLVLTRGVTSNSTCELVFPSFPSRGSGSHETQPVHLDIYMRALGLQKSPSFPQQIPVNREPGKGL